MSNPIFSLTHTSIHDHFFPSLSVFSASTKPTSTIVGEIISAAASDLNGRARAQGLNPDSFDAAGEPAAFNWCQDYVRLASAIRVVESMAGTGAVPKWWTEQLKAKQDALEKYGFRALGDASNPSESAHGMRTHIKHFTLDTGDTNDISDLIPKFRRSDNL